MWSNVFIAVLSVTILFPICYFALCRVFDDKAPKIGFLVVAGEYIALYIFDTVYGFLPTFGDVPRYTAALSRGTSASDVRGAVQVFWDFVWPIRMVGGGVSLHIVLSSLAFVTGATLVWRAWLINTGYIPSKREYLTFYSVLFFWPAAALYLSAALREGYVLFCWGLSLYGLVTLVGTYTNGHRYQDLSRRNPISIVPMNEWITQSGSRSVSTRNKIERNVRRLLDRYSSDLRAMRNMLFFVLGTSGLYFLRREFVPALIIFAAFVVAWHYRRYIKSIISGGILFATVGFIGANQVGYGYLFSPEQIGAIRNARAATIPDAAYAAGVDWNSWLDIGMQSIPLGVLFMISPFRTSAHPFGRFIASADAIYVNLLTIIAAVWIVARWRRGNVEDLGWVLGTMAMILGIGLFEFHVTGAVRHRMPIVMCLLPPSAIAIKKRTQQYGLHSVFSVVHKAG